MSQRFKTRDFLKNRGAAWLTLPLSRRWLWALAFVVWALGLAMRGLILTSPITITGDAAERYYPLARSLWLDHGFSRQAQAPFLPDRFDQPGYPWFLSLLFRVFGVNLVAVAAVQMALELAILWMSYQLARLLKVPQRVQIGALAIGWLWPLLPLWSARLMTEIAATFVLTLSCLLFTRALRLGRESAKWWWMAAGLCGGAAILLRADTIPAVALMMLMAALSRRGKSGVAPRVLRRLTACVGLMALMLVPWTLRNHFVFQRTTPLGTAATSQSNGYVVWLGTWVDDTRWHKPYWWDILKPDGPRSYPREKIPDVAERKAAMAAIRIARRKKMFAGSPSQTFFVLATRHKKQYPWQSRVDAPLRRVAMTWWRVPGYTPLSTIRGFERHGLPKHVHSAREMLAVQIMTVWWCALLVLSAIGSLHAWRRRMRWMAPVFALVIGRSLLPFVSGIGVEPRYIIETLPAIFLLSALGIEAIRGWFVRMQSTTKEPQINTDERG